MLVERRTTIALHAAGCVLVALVATGRARPWLHATARATHRVGPKERRPSRATSRPSFIGTACSAIASAKARRSSCAPTTTPRSARARSPRSPRAATCRPGCPRRSRSRIRTCAVSPTRRSRRSRAGPQRARPKETRATCRPNRELPSGWRLGPPDLVVELPQPYRLPAEGPDVIRNFVIPLHAAGRFAAAVELRPGAPGAVHHATVLADTSGTARQLDLADPEPGYEGMVGAVAPGGHFLGWTPGRQPRPLGEGMAWQIEARHRPRAAAPPGADRSRRVGSSGGRSALERRAAAPTAGGHPPRLDRDGHPAGRSRLRRHRLVRTAGRRRSTVDLSARALHRQGDGRLGGAARRRRSAAAAHSGVGLRLAGRVLVRAAGGAARRNAAASKVRLRQLGGEPEESVLSASAWPLGTSLDRRHGRLLAPGGGA